MTSIHGTGSVGEDWFDEEPGDVSPVEAITKRTIIDIDGSAFLVAEVGSETTLVFRGVEGRADGVGSLTVFNPMRRRVLAAYRALRDTP